MGWAHHGQIIDLDRRRRHGVAESDINLDRDARAVNCRCRADPYSAIFRLVSDWRCPQRGDFEDDAVIRGRLAADVAESLGNGLGFMVAKTKKIEIAGWPKRIGDPRRKEQAPLRMKRSRCAETLSR